MGALQRFYQSPRLLRVLMVFACIFFLAFFSGFNFTALVVSGYFLFSLLFLPQTLALFAALCVYLKLFDRGLALCKMALELDPRCYDALCNMGYLYINLRDYRQAVPYLDRAIELHPGRYISLLNRGVCAQSIGLYDDALIYFSQARTCPENKTDRRGDINYIATLIGQNRFSEALKELNAMKADGAYHDYVTHNKIACHVMLHQLEQARAVLAQYRNKNGDINKFGNVILAFADEDFVEALTLTSQYSDLDRFGLHFKHYRALSLSGLGEAEQAYNEALQAMQSDMQSPTGLLMMLGVYDQSLDFETRDLLVKSLLALSPRLPSALELAAQLALAKGDFEEAQSFMDRVSALSEPTLLTHSLRARIAESRGTITGDFEPAHKALSELARMTEEHGVYWFARGRLHLAIAEAQKDNAEDLKQAIFAFRKFLQKQPHRFAGRLHLARALTLAGSEEATATREQAEREQKEYEDTLLRCRSEKPLIWLETESGAFFDSLLKLEEK